MPTKATQSETQRIPKLRFAGFFGGWEEEKLGKIVKVERGGSPRPIESYITQNDNGVPWIKIGDLKTGSRFVTETAEKIKPEGVKRSREVYPGDFILSNSMSFGRPYIVKIHGCIHDGWLALRNVEKNKVTDTFLYELLHSETMKKKFLSLAAGSAVKNLKSETVQAATIGFPSILEQQKVADFLELIGEYIENLKEQKENLESYKKGMMQKIFSQEIRFKDEKGKEFPKWLSLSLSNLISAPVSDGPHTTPKFLTEGIPFLSVDNLVNNRINTAHLRYISKADDLEFSRKCKPQKGDILLGKAASVGEVAIVDSDFNFNVWSPIAVIRLKKEYSFSFFYFAFQTSFVKKQIRRFINTSSQENLGMGDINKIVFKIPDYKEQQKIADFLTAVDKVIESKQRQIAEAEQWKKGLMQGLFV